MFLFSCYTGISYGDMCRLTAANIETSKDGTVWIKATQDKTNVEFEIPLLDLPRHIINKYRDTISDGKLLPMYGNSEINRGLKQLARKRRVKAPPKSVLLNRRLRHKRIAIFSNRRGEGLTSKSSIVKKNRPTRKGRGVRPAKDNPVIYRFSTNFSTEE